MIRLLSGICIALGLAAFAAAGEHPEHPQGAAVPPSTPAASQPAPAPAAAQAAAPAAAQEHPEHPMGKKNEAPVGSKAWIKQIRKEYDDKVCEVSKSKTKEPFVIHDDKLNKDWQLKLVKVHKNKIVALDPEGKHFFACSDFKSVKKGDPGKVDIDFYATKNPDGSLTIDKTLIHKVDGKERYKYNEKNEMVPVN